MFSRYYTDKISRFARNDKLMYTSEIEKQLICHIVLRPLNFAVNSLNSHSRANGARSEALALSMYFQVVMDSRFRGNDKYRSGNDKLGGDDRKIKPAVFTQGMLFFTFF